MAKESTERWQKGTQLSIFDGIPVAIKDEYIVVSGEERFKSILLYSATIRKRQPKVSKQGSTSTLFWIFPKDRRNRQE